MAKDLEVEAVKAILDKDWGGEVTADVVASAVIKALDKTRDSLMRPLGAPLRVGLLFKPRWSNRTMYVPWMGLAGPSGGIHAWVVCEDWDYGGITDPESRLWRWNEPVEDEVKIRKVSQGVRDSFGNIQYDESGKMIRETVEKQTGGLAARLSVNEMGMVAGDKVTLRQDGQFTIEAVFSRGVLMRSRQSGLVWAEENGNLKKYYTDGWR